MPLSKFLSQRLNISESDIFVLGHANDQLEVMHHYEQAKRDGSNITGVPVGIDGSIVTVNLDCYAYAGDGAWVGGDFAEFEGEFEVADEHYKPEPDLYERFV